MTNAYPELPSLPYQHTSVSMSDVIAYLKTAAFPLEVLRATYIVFRNESANGQSGVNNNYAGMQADGSRWPTSLDRYFVGTTTAVENGTGKTRIFIAFASWQDCVACLADRLLSRGLYVGGRTHLITQMDVTSGTALANAYHKEWVTGSATSVATPEQTGNFLSMYAQATALFRPSVEVPTPPTVIPKPPEPTLPSPVVPPDLVAENARLRFALADIGARVDAALAALPVPPVVQQPPAPDPDNSSDDLNQQVLNILRP